MRERPLATPNAAVDVATWINHLDPLDAAYIQGYAFQRMAIAAGVSEAALYADFAERAKNDPDAQVVRDH